MALETVIVTGASRGIGRSIAERFLREGWRVAATARTLEPLRSLEKSYPGLAQAHRMDVRDRPEVERIVAEVAREFEHIDVVVNNAGISGHTPIDRDDDARWQDILATNLTGAMYVARAALRHMPRGGRIINNASVLGKFGVPRMGAYCATKHGIIGWTRALALELADRDISVNAVCPGWVESDMAEQGVKETAAVLGITPDAFRRQAIDAVPQKRFLDPAEVADLVFYLASAGSRGITGQAISICAGQTVF
jgi:ketoreductase